MRASREIKLWINRARKSRGKRNGVVRFLFDNPRIERMLGTSKKSKDKNKND